MSESPYWPTKGWRPSTPEEQGLTSGRIAQALRDIRARVPRMHSLMIVRNGCMVAEAFFYPFGPDWRHGVASCTKAVLSSLVGAAIQQGHLRSIRQRALDFFPGRRLANREGRKEAITLEHLLTMSSGLHCVYNHSEVTLYEMRASADWAQFMLDQPMDFDPGTHFLYNSGASHLLSVILSAVTGQSALEFARAHLFGPLGIQDVAWDADPQGNSCGWGHLHLQPRDMAKFGYLFLNDGVWEGRRILPQGWVAESTRTRFDPWPRGHSYGLLWWQQCAAPRQGPRGAAGAAGPRPTLEARRRGFGPIEWYFAAGIGVQLIAVAPGANLVCAITASTDQEDRDTLFGILEQHVIAAAQATPRPPDAEGQTLLEGEIAAAAREPARAIPDLPELALHVSGRAFAFEPNRLGWRTLALTFAADSGEAQVSLNGSTPVAVGLDGVPRITAEPERTLRSTWLGGWDGETFVLEQDTLSQYRRYQLRLAFHADDLTVSSHECANGVDEEFKGHHRG